MALNSCSRSFDGVHRLKSPTCGSTAETLTSSAGKHSCWLQVGSCWLQHIYYNWQLMHWLRRFLYMVILWRTVLVAYTTSLLRGACSYSFDTLPAKRCCWKLIETLELDSWSIETGFPSASVSFSLFVRFTGCKVSGHARSQPII